MPPSLSPAPAILFLKKRREQKHDSQPTITTTGAYQGVDSGSEIGGLVCGQRRRARACTNTPPPLPTGRRQQHPRPAVLQGRRHDQGCVWIEISEIYLTVTRTHLDLTLMSPSAPAPPKPTPRMIQPSVGLFYFLKKAPQEPTTYIEREKSISICIQIKIRLCCRGVFFFLIEGFLTGRVWATQCGKRGGGSRGKWNHFDNAFLSNWKGGGRFKRSSFWKLFFFVFKHFPLGGGTF